MRGGEKTYQPHVAFGVVSDNGQRPAGKGIFERLLLFSELPDQGLSP
jgi:hypothetical protein